VLLLLLLLRTLLINNLLLRCLPNIPNFLEVVGPPSNSGNSSGMLWKESPR